MSQEWGRGGSEGLVTPFNARITGLRHKSRLNRRVFSPRFFNINLSVLMSTNHARNTVYVFYRQHFIRGSYIRSVSHFVGTLQDSPVSIRDYLSLGTIRNQSEYLSPCNIVRFFLVFAFRLDAPDSVARARGDSRRCQWLTRRLLQTDRDSAIASSPSRISPSSDYARVPSSFPSPPPPTTNIRLWLLGGRWINIYLLIFDRLIFISIFIL